MNDISIEKIGYDEYGSLVLRITERGGGSETYSRFIYNDSSTRSYKYAGEIRINGWLPNPPPPGYAFQLESYEGEYYETWWGSTARDVLAGTRLYRNVRIDDPYNIYPYLPI